MSSQSTEHGEGSKHKVLGPHTRMIVGREKAREGEQKPQKRYFRQRAHVNPLAHNSNFDHAIRPDDYNYKEMFPEWTDETGALEKPIEFVDIGCGFGGLLFGLQPLFPSTLMVGMEIRTKLAEYVRLKILSARKENPGHYQNLGVLWTNSMRYMPNFFKRGQLSKMFFCFPDPHFKKKKHSWRIINYFLLAEYAYCLRPGGMLYTITDVEDLHLWMDKHASENAAFEKIPPEEAEKDPCVQVMKEATEEGKKVTRNEGKKYIAVFKRLTDEETEENARKMGFWREVNQEVKS
eukprot:gb/GECG01012300.1/.p1 GENE.gb/GECG01012300.1/~~gb/GECG01012300.1/.p1  ORF type:complete len:292 (+),score=45.11 gb/GECG01012300.1/:1-876(+)